LLESSDDLLTASKVPVLDKLPSLGLKVTAFGFPLGSEFGIGLTATGGQVSRQPVAASKTDSEEQTDIKNAVWHDAVLSSGNSGGPLFSDSNILVGVNFAKLSVEDKHALAIPGSVVAAFLRACNAAEHVTFESQEKKPTAAVDPRAITVFVEVWGDSESVGEDTAIANSAKNAIDAFKRRFQQQLPVVSDEILEQVREGQVEHLLPPETAGDIDAGTVARIKGAMTVIQVLEDGLLVEIDGVRCAIMIDADKAAEIGAKFGNEIIRGIPIDMAVFVGPATSYTTVVGTTNHVIPLMPMGAVVKQPQFARLLSEELSHRQQERNEAQAHAEALERKEEAEKLKNLEQRYLTKLRHTFKDASGKFQIDAVALKLDEDKVELMRLSDRRKVTVQLKKLCENDRKWLTENKTWVKVYGGRLKEIYSKDPQ
jgi:hypothetical protein